MLESDDGLQAALQARPGWWHYGSTNEEILAKAGVPDSAVAYVGDDLPDLPILRRVGLAVGVGNAVPEVKHIAHYTTKSLAGQGAIRET